MILKDTSPPSGHLENPPWARQQSLSAWAWLALFQGPTGPRTGSPALSPDGSGT